MTTNISKAGSLKGYSFKVWFARNKDVFKTILIGVTALATYFSTQGVPQWAQIALTGILPFIVKLAIDAIDFWTTDVKI